MNEERIARLEKEVRLWRIVYVSTIGICAMAFVLAASRPSPDIVEARTFRILDAGGHIVGVFGVGDNGEPHFGLGGGLQGGLGTVAVGTGSDGSAGIVLSGAMGKGAITLAVKKKTVVIEADAPAGGSHSIIVASEPLSDFATYSTDGKMDWKAH